MIWTLPRGLALGRSGGVGVDGSLTGLFTFFIVCMGMARGTKKIFRGGWSAGLGMPGWLAGSDFFQVLAGSSKSGVSAGCFVCVESLGDQPWSSQALRLPTSQASRLSDLEFELFIMCLWSCINMTVECPNATSLEPARPHPVYCTLSSCWNMILDAGSRGSALKANVPFAQDLPASTPRNL